MTRTTQPTIEKPSKYAIKLADLPPNHGLRNEPLGKINAYEQGNVAGARLRKIQEIPQLTRLSYNDLSLIWTGFSVFWIEPICIHELDGEETLELRKA